MSTTMLTSRRDSKPRRRVEVYLDRKAELNLARARERYEALIGRPVSASIAIRRGLDLLAEYLESVHGDAWTHYEQSKLVHHIR